MSLSVWDEVKKKNVLDCHKPSKGKKGELVTFLVRRTSQKFLNLNHELKKIKTALGPYNLLKLHPITC